MPKSSNAQTPHSRALRREHANERIKRLMAEGWKNKLIFFSPDELALIDKYKIHYGGIRPLMVAALNCIKRQHEGKGKPDLM